MYTLWKVQLGKYDEGGPRTGSYFLLLPVPVANDFEIEVHLASLEFSQLASCEDDW